MTEKTKPKLIVFDVEGILVPRNLFIFHVGKKIGFTKLIQVLWLGLLYQIGLTPLNISMKLIFKIIKGTKIDTLMDIFENITATPRLKTFFDQLKTRNYKIALISSGLPTIIVKKLAEYIGADYSFGIEVGLDEQGALTGEISGDAITQNGKIAILNKILTLEELTLNDCIVIADDRNNRCLFLPQVKKIGYNPDFIIRVKSDYIVMGKLSGILPIIDGGKVKRSFPSRNDFVREYIHAAGFLMPVIAGFIGVLPVSIFIIALSSVYLISELLRLQGKNIPVISTITHNAASQSELYGFTAAPLYFAFGILFTLIIFPLPASGAAIAMFALGDSAASLFGGLIGKRIPFNKGKTWEGTIMGFIFAFSAGSLFISPLIALIGAAIAMTIESLPLPINDNVTIPVLTALALTLLI